MTPFILTCAARSGSTMLRHMLNSHPQILCHGEVFKIELFTRFYKKMVIGSLDGKQGVEFIENPLERKRILSLFKSDVPRFIDEIVYKKDEKSQQAVGFKYKTDEYFNDDFHLISDHLRQSKNIFVIHLKRRDLLKQYISHLLVLKQKVPTFRFKRDSIKDEIRPFQIKKNDLARYLKDVVFREGQIEKDFRDHEIYEIWYEDILDDPDQTIGDLLVAIGVNKISLPMKTSKIIDNHYSLVTNLDEIMHLFKAQELSHRTCTNL